MIVKLARKWSEYLSGLPQTGEGYHDVDVLLRDGSEIKGLRVYNNEIELPLYSHEISDMTLHEGSMDRVAIKMRIKPPRRRNPMDRLKSRLYYRRNRSKIRLQRKKYLRKHKTTLKRRKQFFQRYKPVWFKKPPKHKPPKPKKFKPLKPPKRKD